MKKFKLKVDQYAGINPDCTYDELEIIDDDGRNILYYVEKYPEDWEEVFEKVEDTISEVDKLVDFYINLSEENKSLFKQKLILYEFR